MPLSEPQAKILAALVGRALTVRQLGLLVGLSKDATQAALRSLSYLGWVRHFPGTRTWRITKPGRRVISDPRYRDFLP
ncbi:hypothetical protein [Nocardia amamiensis]|uniref:hypothetical protein n=1 Tax=Nocardia amamiensis TaxID=404578 RepID=UPI00340FB7DB